jgi:hypothetical protein
MSKHLEILLAVPVDSRQGSQLVPGGRAAGEDSESDTPVTIHSTFIPLLVQVVAIGWRRGYENFTETA